MKTLVPLSHSGGALAGSDQLVDDIDGIRDHLGSLIDELDRRRHQAFNLRRHPIPFIVGSVLLTGVVAGTVALLVMRRRHRRRMRPRLRRLRTVVARLVSVPDQVAPRRHRPRVSGRIARRAVEAILTLMIHRIDRNRRRANRRA